MTHTWSNLMLNKFYKEILITSSRVLSEFNSHKQSISLERDLSRCEFDLKVYFFSLRFI